MSLTTEDLQAIQSIINQFKFDVDKKFAEQAFYIEQRFRQQALYFDQKLQAMAKQIRLEIGDYIIAEILPQLDAYNDRLKVVEKFVRSGGSHPR